MEIKKIEAIVALTKKKTLVSISNQTLTRIHLSLESWGLKMWMKHETDLPSSLVFYDCEQQTTSRVFATRDASLCETNLFEEKNI